MPAAHTTRRELLGTGLGAAAAALVLPRRARATAADKRVIVVGAGLAGLVTAYELDRGGFDVIVLEARDRVGGRVHTIRGFEAGQLAEAGGEYIDTSHTALLGYVRHLGLRLDDMRAQGSDLPQAVYIAGRRVARYRFVTPQVQRDLDRYGEAITKLSDPIDPADPAAGGAHLDQRSAAGFIDSLNLDDHARWLIRHETIKDDYTVRPERLSLLAVAAAEAAGPNLPSSGVEAFRVHGGNDQVPAALAAALGPRVQLSSPVTSISWTSDRVQVSTQRGTVAARRCVIAAPLPPLRAVRFQPGLPAPLPQAIAELQYGSGTKTLLQYRRRFWVDQGFGGDTLTDLPVSTTWAATNAQPGKPGILLAYTVGPEGRRFSALSDASRIQTAASQLDRIYPGSRGLLQTAATIAWRNERYSGGTYSAPAPGQVTRFWKVLRRPLGPFRLAGEHTDDQYWGYMEGAVRSGKRAARAIIAGG